MDITSPDSSGSITLTPLMRERGRMPTLYVRAQVVGEGFGGAHPRIALEISDLTRFVAEVEDLASEHAEIATLHGLSPKTFLLSLRVVQPTIFRKEVIVTAAIGRYVHVDPLVTPLFQDVSVRFLLPFDELPDLAARLRVLCDATGS